MGRHKERIFENEVIELLKESGYIEGISKNYNQELALYPSDLIEYIKTTSPKEYKKLSRIHGSKVDDAI
jgi:type I restriction enzyme R subunit